jgi:hypothetical protein
MPAGMPESGEVAVHVQARGDDGGLDRVEHVEAVGRCCRSPCQPSLGLEHPVLAHRPMPSSDEVVGAQTLNHQSSPHSSSHLAHGAAEIERLGDRLLDQGGAARRLHHRRSHVAGWR